MAVARGAAAKAFCERHVEAYSFRCSYDRYDQRDAGVLCRSWAHRAQYYYDAERRDPMGQAVIFGPRHHAAYQEPSELLLLLASPGVRQATLDRAKELRETFVVD